MMGWMAPCGILVPKCWLVETISERARTRARVSKVPWEMGSQPSARGRLSDSIMSR